jgi:hypothetical protein
MKLLRVTTPLLFLSILISALYMGCDKGLEPPAVPVGVAQATISGKIHFPGRWPRKDSVVGLFLVLIQPAPPYLESTLISGINTTVLPIQLNYLSSDTSYAYAVKVQKYSYLGVAQLYGANTTADWHIVGFAHDALDSAISFDVTPGAQLKADITVNFDSLPRQPFKQ